MKSKRTFRKVVQQSYIYTLIEETKKKRKPQQNFAIKQSSLLEEQEAKKKEKLLLFFAFIIKSNKGKGTFLLLFLIKLCSLIEGIKIVHLAPTRIVGIIINVNRFPYNITRLQ